MSPRATRASTSCRYSPSAARPIARTQAASRRLAALGWRGRGGPAVAHCGAGRNGWDAWPRGRVAASAACSRDGAARIEIVRAACRFPCEGTTSLGPLAWPEVPAHHNAVVPVESANEVSVANCCCGRDRGPGGLLGGVRRPRAHRRHGHQRDRRTLVIVSADGKRQNVRLDDKTRVGSARPPSTRSSTRAGTSA